MMASSFSMAIANNTSYLPIQPIPEPPVLGVCRNEFGGPARLHRKSTERCIAKYIANRIDCDLGFKCAHVADSDPLVHCFCCSLGGLRAQFSPKQLQQVVR